MILDARRNEWTEEAVQEYRDRRLRCCNKADRISSSYFPAFGRFAPYLERETRRLSTPVASYFPRTMV